MSRGLSVKAEFLVSFSAMTGMASGCKKSSISNSQRFFGWPLGDLV